MIASLVVWATLHPNAAIAAAPVKDGVYIIEVSPELPPSEVEMLLSTLRVETLRPLRHGLNGAIVSADAAGVQRLLRDPHVLAVEPDSRISSAELSVVPWGIDRVDQRSLPLDGSFIAPSTGDGVGVYVVDSGVRSDHVELAGRVRVGVSVVSDGSGTEDCNGHGTHVAATAAGTTFGVASHAMVVAVRVLGCDGTGTTSGLVAALDWVVQDHHDGPAVVNLSLETSRSRALERAVAAMVADGISVVAAAGNSGVDACKESPARVREVVVVGATDETDTRPTWSNYGRCVDMFAPGALILSASGAASTATEVMSGTSMAAPHAAGAAALLLQQQPELTGAEVQARLVADATTGTVVSAGRRSPNRLLFVG